MPLCYEAATILATLCTVLFVIHSSLHPHLPLSAIGNQIKIYVNTCKNELFNEVRMEAEVNEQE